MSVKRNHLIRESPVGGNISGGILQVAVDDPQEVGDFFPAGLMGTQPAVFKPFLQAHFRFR